MAFYTDITSRPSGSIAEAFKAAYVKYVDRAARRAAYRQTVRELSALSSRELADLGMHHSNIKSVALEAMNSRG